MMIPNILDFLSLLIILQYMPLVLSTKYELSLGERAQRLFEMSSKETIISINYNKFIQILDTWPRNYTYMIMFTSSQPNCAICKQAYEEYSVLANSWRLSSSFSNALFFTMVDFDDANEVFEEFELLSVPAFYLVPPKGKKKSREIFDIQLYGFAAELMAKFIYIKTAIQIPILRQPSYSGTVALILLCFLVGGLLYLRRNSLNFLYQPNLWASLSLFFVFVMISGQMWNHIRGPPFMHRNPKTGQVNYIRHDGRSQFIVESYIVLILFAATTVGVILLNEATSSSKIDYNRRKIVAIVGLALLSIFFSLILSIFRSKYQGYPYSFLFK